MSIFFSEKSETSLKMRSQILFLGSSVLWGAGLVPNVYCEKNMRIGQGLNMLFNPPFNVPLSEL
jgi:hypothetical protein